MTIACPENGEVEHIEVDPHPMGRLLLICSRYAGCPIDCSRRCTAMLDRGDRDRTDPDVICASADGTGLRRLRTSR